MTNNLTGLTALIVAITGLITGIGTLYLHLRSQSHAKSQKASSTIQSPRPTANDLQSENRPFQPGQ